MLLLLYFSIINSFLFYLGNKYIVGKCLIFLRVKIVIEYKFDDKDDSLWVYDKIRLNFIIKAISNNFTKPELWIMECKCILYL